MSNEINLAYVIIKTWDMTYCKEKKKEKKKEKMFWREYDWTGKK